MIDTAVILAGGLGTRLLPLTKDCPKPLIGINGVPFIRYLLKSLKDEGIKRVILLTGYMSESFEKHFDLYPVPDLDVVQVSGKLEWDTGKRVSEALPHLPDIFLLLYADNYWPIPLKKMWQHYSDNGLPNMCTVFRNDFGTAEYGAENNLFYDPSSNIVKDYDNEERSSSEFNGVDIGFFIVNKDCFPIKVQSDYSLKMWMKKTISENKLLAYATEEQYYFITSPYLKLMFESHALHANLEFC